MMTLQELMQKADTPGNTKRVPSLGMIMESGSPVIAREKLGTDIEITAFRNGYIAYRCGNDITVFPLLSCREYCGKSSFGEEVVYPYEIFADEPWHLRAYMEGEERLVHNSNNNRRYAKELSLESCLAGNRYNTLDTDGGASDPLSLMIEKEDAGEEAEKLHSVMEKLTERQRFIVIQCIVKGRMHVDVAAELGTTRMNVSDTLRKALRKMRRAYGIPDPDCSVNRFYHRKGWKKASEACG